MKRYRLFVAIFLINMLFTTYAYADDLVLGAGGKVSVELLTSDADYSNTLSLVSPKFAVLWSRGCILENTGDLKGQLLMSEKKSQHGCRDELDADFSTDGIQSFENQTPLEFNFCAQIDGDPDCEHIWSSNVSKNSDGYNHVRIKPLYDRDWPGKIYQLGWEDREGGGDEDFNDLIAIVRVDMDSDGDGLWDDWETEGIDTDGDGIPNYKIPGADPKHADIYLQIDYMDCAKGGAGVCIKDSTHNDRPTNAAMDNLVKSFANSPIKNPDGKDGINLHYEIDNPVPHQDDLEFSGKNTQFDTIKNTYFGQNNPRRFVYHYELFAHQLAAPLGGKSGQAEEGGNDFVVTIPDVGDSQQDLKITSSTMHELGHNLGLEHGGADDTDYKPNYLSVMNYQFQLPGIPPNSRIDYSRSELPKLDENHLNETIGIQDGTDNTWFYCITGGFNALGKGTGPIDWDCDNDGGIEKDVKVNLANSDSSPGVVEYTELKGYDDWKNLKYSFQEDGDFEDGVHLNVGIPEEINLKGEIYGTKWEDINGNGIKDPGELGLDNWSIIVKSQNGIILFTTSTDKDGNYNITGLTNGNYIVGEVAKEGYIQTYPKSGIHSIEINNGTILKDIDFGNFKLGEVRGMKWEDLNANSKKDPIETILTGWEINIKGKDTITDEEIDITTTTDINGNYSFKNLTAGTYIISEKLMDEWVQTTPATRNYTVTITSGTHIKDQDFGNFHKGKITGGGWISITGDPKATFGIEGQYPDSSDKAKGNVEYQDHKANLNIKSIQINTSATTLDKKKGAITGLAQVNGAGSYPFEVYVEDNGEPGKGTDMFKISLPTYPYSNGATLSYGNVQIHE